MRADFRKGKSPDAIADLETGSAAVVVTDPPWGTGDGDSPQYGRRQRHEAEGRGDPTIHNDTNLDELRQTAQTIARVLAEDGVAWVFCGHARREAEDIMAEVGLYPFMGGVQWDKGTPGMTHDIRYCHIQILLCIRDEKVMKEHNPIISPLRYQLVQRTVHPNEKPIPLLRHLIKWALTRKGEDEPLRDQLVLDPFAGVVTSALAAIPIGQRWCGAECDPRWYPECDARLDNLTGKFGRYPDTEYQHLLAGL